MDKRQARKAQVVAKARSNPKSPAAPGKVEEDERTEKVKKKKKAKDKDKDNPEVPAAPAKPDKEKAKVTKEVTHQRPRGSQEATLPHAPTTGITHQGNTLTKEEKAQRPCMFLPLKHN